MNSTKDILFFFIFTNSLYFSLVYLYYFKCTWEIFGSLRVTNYPGSGQDSTFSEQGTKIEY